VVLSAPERSTPPDCPQGPVAVSLGAVALLSRAGVVLALVGGVTFGAGTRDARAEAPTPFRVESSAGVPCPTGDPFATQLLRRTDRIREAVGDESALVFRLEVKPGRHQTSGRLTVRELDGSETERQVAGASCQEVVSAMVLIAAILVDPNASLEPLPPPPAPKKEPPKPPPSAAPPPPAKPASTAPPGAVIPAGRTPPPGALLKPRPAPARDQRPQGPSERSGAAPDPTGRSGRGDGWLDDLTAGAGIAFALEGAPLPKLATGVALVGTLAFERDAILSPLLEASAARTQTVRVGTPSGVADFRFSSLRLLACPVRFPAVSVVAVRPCALGELGELEGIGKVTDDPARVVARWVAVGGAARLSVRLFGPLALLAEGAVVVPLIRHEFYFDPQGPETMALKVPSAGISSRLGMAAEFE
jgi:hypothetical protein